MPWSGRSFAERHNRKLKGKAADKAAKIANAMIERGEPESISIATANARAGDKPSPAKTKREKLYGRKD